MAKKATKYKGVLNEPMELVWPGFFGSKESAEARLASSYREQVAIRMGALTEHFGIKKNDPNALSVLLLRLAQEHVPGFQVKKPFTKKKGRPGKWAGQRSLQLFADVRSLVKNGLNEHSACRVLANNPRYRSRYEGITQANLYRRFTENKTNDSIVANLLGQCEGDSSEIENYLIEFFALGGK